MRKKTAAATNENTRPDHSTLSASDALIYSSQERNLTKTLNQDIPPVATHLTATASEGTVRSGHGIMIKFSGFIQGAESIHGGGYCLDVHGDNIFNALPYGLGHVAVSFLPFGISIQASQARSYQNYSGSVIIGAKSLSRNRIDEVLKSIREKGDHPFVFEIRGPQSELVGFLPTQASLIEQSLRMPHGCNIRYCGELPTFKAKSSTWLWVKWLKFAISLCIGIWLVFLYPSPILSTLPPLLSPITHINSTRYLTNTLPLCPQNMTEAFILGQLHQQIAHSLSSSSLPVEEGGAGVSETVKALLQQAEVLTGRDAGSVTIQMMNNLPDEIQRLEGHDSMITRVRGLFSFINLLWLFSIIGIAVSIGPSVYHVLYPLRDLIMRISDWVFHQIILPVVTRCHSYGIFEALCYTLVYLLIIQGYRMGKEDMAMYVSFTGSVLSLPCVAYSTLLWGKRLVKRYEGVNTLRQLGSIWLLLCCFPCAVHFSSTLYAYSAVIASYSLLGSVVFVGRLCIVLGFESKNSAILHSVASFLLLLLFVVFRVWGVADSFLRPFSSPISVIGGHMLFLSLMILSDDSNGNEKEALRSNILMFVILLLFLLLGFLNGLSSLTNVAIVYSILWSMQKYISFHCRSRFNVWPLVLILSLVVWRLSLFFHLNPHYITNLFVIE
jgi:hypothetical protein